MGGRSLQGFQRRVWLGVTLVGAYLVLLLGLHAVTLWQSHERLRAETAARARLSARAALDEDGDTLRRAFADWARGGSVRRPSISRRLQQEEGVIDMELLSPTGWAIGERTGGSEASVLDASQQRRVASGESLVDFAGLDAEPAYAVVSAFKPVLDADARLLGIVRVDVGAEALALSRRALYLGLGVEGGSLLVFFVLLGLLTRWTLRPLALLDRTTRAGDDATTDEMARADDTGFVIDTYRNMIEQLRAKETELRRLRDVERHRADALQELNASIVDSMLSGVVVLDLSGGVRVMNDAARALLAVARDERVTGRKLEEALRHAPEVIARVRACLDEGIVVVRDEMRLGLPGVGRRDVSLSISPLRGPEGERAGALCVLTDLTEVKRLQEEMRLRQNLAELGEMSAGVAHEFRNSLATILGFAQLVERHGDAGAREHAAAIAEECAALRRVIDDFLRFANPARLVIESVDLAALFESLADDVKARAGSKRVRYELLPGLPVVSGDETLLRRTFTNVLRNAVDAAREGGVVRASAEMGDGEVHVHVDDDGPGIPEADRQRIFVPFFTGKESGTGLGLALARKVVVYHGGRIVAETSPLGGARLTVTLPVRRGAERPRSDE
jgi:PAS domain S-box-containing protein